MTRPSGSALQRLASFCDELGQDFTIRYNHEAGDYQAKIIYGPTVSSNTVEDAVDKLMNKVITTTRERHQLKVNEVNEINHRIDALTRYRGEKSA